MTKMSIHTKTDNLDRMIYIATTVGFGNVIFEQVLEDKRELITDTGVILVKALAEDFLITAYLCSMEKVVALYLSQGQATIPIILRKAVKSNVKHNRLYLQNNTVF